MRCCSRVCAQCQGVCWPPWSSPGPSTRSALSRKEGLQIFQSGPPNTILCLSFNFTVRSDLYRLICRSVCMYQMWQLADCKSSLFSIKESNLLLLRATYLCYLGCVDDVLEGLHLEELLHTLNHWQTSSWERYFKHVFVRWHVDMEGAFWFVR